jgi:hypothetical protein
MEAMMFFELGWTGHPETSAFQGLSSGKTYNASRMRSASSVSNITGRVTVGIGGRGRPSAATPSAAASASQAKSTRATSGLHLQERNEPQGYRGYRGKTHRAKARKS